MPVLPYIPNPLRCFKCQKIPYGKSTCYGRLTCACCQLDHDSKACQYDRACINSKRQQFAYSRESRMKTGKACIRGKC